MPAKRKFFSLTALRNRLSTNFREQAPHLPTPMNERNQELLSAIPNDDENLPSLPATKMTLQDLKDIFNLHEHKTRNFMKISESDKIPVPPELERELEEELAMLAADPKNEAECKIGITKLFLDALKRERRALAASANPPEYLPCFTLETNLGLEVFYKGRKMLLNGDMDYSMLYARDETSAGLVILEAKSFSTMGKGLAQCLTYMAMVHAIRISEGRENAVIWGIVSNSQEFQFLRIDNDGKYVRWQPDRTWGPNTKTIIYTMFRLIIRSAAVSSPRTSTQAVRRISPHHPLTAHPARYHLRVGSADDEDEEQMTF
ncbi:hypothetical protein ASPCAL10123 [Aspergillus calidoustus]|uniref:Uncharacterized protein n=1 Tax=Aspergillus calidoustus TaxID=454130 RepID=A0A0U5CBS9_ASPCI|nr:hypothetical protein ASPCAL10123 [Aspergillus calidoustus]